MIPKNADLWLPATLRSAAKRPKGSLAGAHVYFCVADHYEPAWRGGSLDLQRERVRLWVERYPEIARRHKDSEGRPPQHTFFYPEEEYQAEHLDRLALLCKQGWGDVEVHLHHDADTAASFREKLIGFKELLHTQHGLLRRNASGVIEYSFIHGNCALNNSHPTGRWCGVDDETSILLETGCYADLTMPSAPDPTQTRKVNSIYYALPQTARRGHDDGIDARIHAEPPANGLLMIQGPLALNWSRRKAGLFPRVENSEIRWDNPPTCDRVKLWIDQRIHVQGAPAHIFVKVCTHGCQEQNLKLLLGSGLEEMWNALESTCSQGMILHYVTAYEMYQQIKRLESAPKTTES